MQCYICYRLKAEDRISTVSEAQMVVNGYSLCTQHANSMSNTDEMLRALDRERR